MAGIDMQRISLGALIIALALLVDDAMTTTDAMLNRLAAGRRQGPGRDLRIPDLCLRHACRHARHDRRVRAGRLCRQLGRRIHFSLFAVVSIALIVSWFVAVIFAPLLGVAILTPPKASASRRARQGLPLLSGLPHLCHAGELDDDRAHAWRCSRRPFLRFR